ncbi:MAG: glycosyltransferase family 4 protein [Planctomycetota bacterium]
MSIITNSSPTISALFLDQSGELGGAELALLDILIGRGSRDQVVLFCEGPFAALLRERQVDVQVRSLSTRVQKHSRLWDQLMTVPAVFGASKYLAGIAKEHGVIFANTQKAAVLGAIAGRVSKRPLIWFLHDLLDADHFSSANRRAVIAITNRWGSYVISNSQATDDAYRKAGGKLPTTVIYNGIDEDSFDRVADQASRTIRTELSVPDSSLLVGVFGRLTPWKGQDILLDALARKELADIHAVVVGEALFTGEDRAYAEHLRSRAASPSYSDRVHFLGHRNDVPKLMKACDVIVHTSTSPEPFGRVIVEGMLAGKPVIATNAGGAKEIISDGINGLLVEPGSVKCLANAISSLRSNPARGDELALAGRARAEQDFSVQQMVRGVNRVIEDVVRENHVK